MDLLAGQVEVGAIAAQAAFGETAGRLTGLILAMLLISTVSAMTMAGPVIQVIGEDYPAIGILGRKNRSGIPATAIWIQSSVALLFILSSTFESVLVFPGLPSRSTVSLPSQAFSYCAIDSPIWSGLTERFFTPAAFTLSAAHRLDSGFHPDQPTG